MKYLIKKYFRKLGFELGKLNTDNSGPYQLYKTLKYFQINTVYDVGANTGQFALELFDLGFLGKVISFEPQSSAHKELITNSKNNKMWYVHKKCAIGSSEGTLSLNISKNSVSSSVLPILDTHVKSANQSVYVSSEQVEVLPFDSVHADYFEENEKSLLKIDTQGYESQVIDGALKSLKNITIIQCELSLIPLYENQLLFKDMEEKLKALGFELWSIRGAFTSQESGQTLQVDALFINKLIGISLST